MTSLASIFLLDAAGSIVRHNSVLANVASSQTSGRRIQKVTV